MTAYQALQWVLDWLISDPTHLMAIAALIAAVVPTPSPTSVVGKMFKVVDILALNILHAKETGVAVPGALSAAAQLAEDVKSAKDDPHPQGDIVALMNDAVTAFQAKQAEHASQAESIAKAREALLAIMPPTQGAAQ